MLNLMISFAVGIVVWEVLLKRVLAKLLEKLGV